VANVRITGAHHWGASYSACWKGNSQKKFNQRHIPINLDAHRNRSPTLKAPQKRRIGLFEREENSQDGRGQRTPLPAGSKKKKSGAGLKEAGDDPSS